VKIVEVEGLQWTFSSTTIIDKDVWSWPNGVKDVLSNWKRAQVLEHH
jgi:hypothetical protein